jgi:glycosyltransferase involved in cell wall biosynthesis
MKTRLVIITEIIAPYRIPVFNALARRSDVDLYVIFLSETDPSLREWSISKTEINFSYKVLPSFRRRLGKYNLLVNGGLTGALRGAAPDIVLCGGYSYVASWQALAWAHRNSVPLILWVESTARDQRRGYAGVERLKKRFIGSSDAFVVPGTSSANYLKTFGVSAEKIFYAPNAVNTSFFSRQSLRRRDLDSRLPPAYFLFVGRLVPEKGVFDLFAAYEKIAPDVRERFGLVVAGNGSARQPLEEWARKIHPGLIVFTGFQHQEDLLRLYANAHALVFPTHSDAWGLVVNEAVACGLPIVATSAAGCVADLVEDGWNGLVTESGNVDQIAHAMERLARNQQMRDSMSLNSLERSRAFSPEACAAGLAQAANSMECVLG